MTEIGAQHASIINEEAEEESLVKVIKVNSFLQITFIVWNIEIKSESY